MIERDGKFITVINHHYRIRDVSAVLAVEEKGTPYIKVMLKGVGSCFMTPCESEEARQSAIDKIMYILNED